MRRIRDHILRFPSAPIYGINRKQDYDFDFTEERPNLHTLRLLTRPGASRRPRQPLRRLFILHNGLNEWENMRFFYQLADWLLKEDEDPITGESGSACLLAPFPGHLMHFPYAGPFAQLPLSRYLSDAGDLFRHFLRYMVETRWLLSILNNSNAGPQPWLVGGRPLSRGDLAGKLHDDWSSLRDASLEARRGGEPPGDENDPERKRPEDSELVGREVTEPDITGTIESIRYLLGRDQRGAPRALPVHVIGYSLGGFLAQSVFFAWPNMVTSCATICSGGAIRALSPTAFAHSEEWQSVLHSLRPEIEGSMLAGKISRDDKDGSVAGMSSDQFGYFHRIFNQVFLQEDQGSYKQRLSEHGSRMLFVSGGEDPIVKTRDVLDASPDEGINMLSVARLTHFLGEDAKTDHENEQREFWLPEAGGLIARAASRAEVLKAQEIAAVRKIRQWASEEEPGEEEEAERKEITHPGERDLASPQFELALDWLMEGISPDEGWLYVCRNSIPAAFLPPDHQLAHATALHHQDVAVQRYLLGLARRASALTKIQERTTLCLSRKLKADFIGSGELFDPHNDAVGRLVTEPERVDAWNYFVEEWNERIRWFKADRVDKRFPRAEESSDEKVKRTGRRAASEFAARTGQWKGVSTGDLKISRLPDVWIAVREGPSMMDPEHPETVANRFVEWVTAIINEQVSEAARHRSQKSSKAFAASLKTGGVRIVRVSGSELNPRYRGRFEQKFEPALLLLAHCAAAVLRSRPGDPPA